MYKYLITLLTVLFTCTGFAYNYVPNFTFINRCVEGRANLQSVEKFIDPNTEFVRALFSSKCQSCHGGGGLGSNKFSNILSASELLANGITSKLGQPEDTVLYQSLIRAVLPMPLGGVPFVQYELNAVKKWIADGSPDFYEDPPPGNGLEFVAYGDLVLCMSQSLSRVNQRDQPFQRFLTLGHIADSNRIIQFNRALAGTSKGLNSISFESILTDPVKVDPNGIVLRIDIRDFGLNSANWKELEKIYPYGVAYFDDGLFRLQEDFLSQATKTDRPHFRSDWFLTQIMQAPLYNEFLFDGQVKNTKDLLRFLGVDELRQLLDGDLRRWGIRGPTGVANFNRVLERMNVNYGGFIGEKYLYRSFDFGSDNAANFQNIFATPFRALDLQAGLHSNKLFRHDAEEWIGSLPNSLQFYGLFDGAGRAIDEASVNLVFDPRNVGSGIVGSGASGAVVNGVSCAGCHSQGMNFSDNTLLPTMKFTADFTNQEIDFAEEFFYQDALELSLDLRADASYFTRAVQTLGITELSYTSPGGEPVYWGIRDHLSDMVGVDEFAGELYLTPDDVKQGCFRAQELCRILGLGDVVFGGSGVTAQVSRRNLEVFYDILVDKDGFNLGKAIKFGGGGIDPPPPPPQCTQLEISNRSAYRWQAYQLLFQGSQQWGHTQWVEKGRTNIHHTAKDARFFLGTGWIYIPNRYFSTECGKYSIVTDEYGTKLERNKK